MGGTRRVTRQERNEARALARRRLLFLAFVLVVSTVGAHGAAALSPAKTFAVASHSMEPLISRGDLVVAGPGTPQVGDVVVYLAATGEYQTHRVMEELDVDGKTLYVTRGDANEGDDSFLVSSSDIVGVVDRSMPLAGYLWLIPVFWKGVLFGALLISYLGVTAWDAKPGRPAVAVSVMLVLLVPTAMAGIDLGYPDSAQAADVVASPLPLSVGDAGSASVATDANSATATAPGALLWKEIPLHGAGSGIAIADNAWSVPSENRVVVDAEHYSPAPTFYLEAYLHAGSASETIEVRLYDTTNGAAVAGTGVAATTSEFVRVRSAGFTLGDANEYTFQAQITSGTGHIRQVKLISSQDAAAATATHVRMSGADSTSSIFNSNVGAAARWQYDGAQTDGTVSAYLEIVAHQSYSGSKLSNGRVHLRDLTAGADAATIVLADGAATRYNVDVSLVDGREYTMRFRSPDAVLGGTTHLHHARLVVVQSGFEKTVSYVDLGGISSTSSTSYVDVGYTGVHHGALEESATHFFEATINAASGRLYDLDASAAVAGAEVTTGSGRSRERSDAFALPSADTQYGFQLRTSTTGHAYSAWIITHLDIGQGLRHDHVLQSVVQTPGGSCTWQFFLTGVSGTSLGRMERGEVDWRAGAAGTSQEAPLPSGRQFTSAVWTGTHAFVFGGTDGTRTNQIVRYDPATDTTTTMAAVLPSARAETSAVWDGTYAYVFGGNSGSGLLDQIVRYDPATDTVAVMAGTLTSGSRHTSAIWDGSHAYIFGGITSGGNTDRIMRYDPASDAVTTMTAVLPTARYGTSAVWDGTRAYVFGGADGNFLDDIVRFDPVADAVTLLSASLPTARYYTSAVWAGTYAYLFGGYDTDHMDRIDRFDPETGRVITMDDRLPTGRYGASAVWDGVEAHIFGGLKTGVVYSDEVVGYHAAVQVLGVVGGTLRQSGYEMPVAPGGTLSSIMDTLPASQGTTVIATTLQGRCVGYGIHTQQAVTYRFT